MIRESTLNRESILNRIISKKDSNQLSLSISPKKLQRDSNHESLIWIRDKP